MPGARRGGRGGVGPRGSPAGASRAASAGRGRAHEGHVGVDEREPRGLLPAAPPAGSRRRSNGGRGAGRAGAAPCGQAGGGDGPEALRPEARSARLSSRAPGPPPGSAAESPAALSGDGPRCGRRAEGLPSPGTERGGGLGRTETSGTAAGLRGTGIRTGAPETDAGTPRGLRVPRGGLRAGVSGAAAGRRRVRALTPHQDPSSYLSPAGAALGARGVGTGGGGTRPRCGCGGGGGRRRKAVAPPPPQPRSERPARRRRREAAGRPPGALRSLPALTCPQDDSGKKRPI